MPDEAARMIRLEKATLSLSEQIAGLASALNAVHEMQLRQVEMDVRTGELERNIVPRAEVKAEQERIRTELVDYRRKLMQKVYGASVLVLALFAILGVLAANYVESKNEHNYQVCLARNKSLSDARSYLIAVRDNSTNPVLRTAAEKASADSASADCEALR